MYYISNQKKKKFKVEEFNFCDIQGFLMGSVNRTFKIDGANIRKIEVVDKKLAYPLVKKKVDKSYDKLILLLTELLVDDDDSGETCRIALNHIEKFRLEIKNKYRSYLKQQDLEKMSNQLKSLQREAKRKLLEINENYMNYQNESHRSR